MTQVDRYIIISLNYAFDILNQIGNSFAAPTVWIYIYVYIEFVIVFSTVFYILFFFYNAGK